MNILFCLLFTVVACYAQDAATGAIVGTVHDSSGALITSASVSAVRDQTHFSRSVRVNAEGSFRLSLLPPGSYSVTVQSDGFEQGLMHAIPVNVGEVTSLSLKLATGKVKVSVQVDATQPQTSALGHVTDESTIQSLPLANRNYTQILALSGSGSGTAECG